MENLQEKSRCSVLLSVKNQNRVGSNQPFAGTETFTTYKYKYKPEQGTKPIYRELPRNFQLATRLFMSIFTRARISMGGILYWANCAVAIDLDKLWNAK